MGKREAKVEQYLDECIEKYFDGFTRKWVSPGHANVPDRICFIDPEWYVEVKTVDGTQTAGQQREAMRLISKGARVAIVYGHEGVAAFIRWLKVNKCSKPQVEVVFK